MRQFQAIALTALCTAAAASLLLYHPLSSWAAEGPDRDANVAPLPESGTALPEAAEIAPSERGEQAPPPGAVLIPLSPEQERRRKGHQFASQWLPYFLYFDDSHLFAPWSLEQIAAFSARGKVVTGLAAAPGEEVLAYAITDEEKSTITLTYLDRRLSRVLSEATQLSDDLWFHQPMFLSPDKRWLLAAGSNGRREAVSSWNSAENEPSSVIAGQVGDIWLLDCAGIVGPRRILSQAALLSCSWDPTAARAVCGIARSADAAPALLLLDAQSAALRPITDTVGNVFWSVDRNTIRVYQPGATGREVLTFDLASGASRRVTEGWPWRASPEAVWSPDGALCAYPETRGEAYVITICNSLGRSRQAPAPAGVKRLIGWSSGPHLLAYLTADSALHFCSGAVSDAQYERLMAAYPPTPAGLDESLPIKSARDGIAFQTSKSPVKVDPSGPLMFAWAQRADGPCLVYLQTDDNGQQINALGFNTISLADMGLDLKADYSTQMIEDLARQNMEAVAGALIAYAKDHNGSLPPHAGGKDLESALEPYLDYVGRLHAPDAPGEIRVRLLVPGMTIEELHQQLRRGKGGGIRIAELDCGDGLVFAILTTTEYGWRAGEFAYEVVVERD